MTKMNQEPFEIEMPMIGPTQNRIYSHPVAQQHTIYLTGELLSADHYIEDFFLLKHATQNDIIDIEINGIGGDMFTAIQFYNAIRMCEAQVTTILQGMAYSAHSSIFLAGDSSVVMPGTSLLVHNGTGGQMGKIEDNLKAAQHFSDIGKEWIRTTYMGFLADEEIDSVIEGYEFWMGSEEVAERLYLRAEYLQQLEEEENPSENPSDNNVDISAAQAYMQSLDNYFDGDGNEN